MLNYTNYSKKVYKVTKSFDSQILLKQNKEIKILTGHMFIQFVKDDIGWPNRAQLCQNLAWPIVFIKKLTSIHVYNQNIKSTEITITINARN